MSVVVPLDTHAVALSCHRKTKTRWLDGKISNGARVALDGVIKISIDELGDGAYAERGGASWTRKGIFFVIGNERVG